MEGADEAEFLELLVANCRIGEWVERIRKRGTVPRQKQALMLLKQMVESRNAYAEEARQAGVVPLCTRILGLTEDEEVLDTCSAIIAACSGHMATAGKASTYTYDGVHVHIREGALGDGLGAKVWMVAHMLCMELAAHRGRLLAGRRVLELGSGCGVCGLAAAALGAASVVLSDVEGPVLRNLRSCMHLNNQPGPESGPGSASEQAQLVGGSGMELDVGEEAGGGPLTDAELFGDAEEVEDLDEVMADLMGGSGAGWAEGRGGPAEPRAEGGGAAGGQGKQERERRWEAGNTSVRLLDWAESQRALDGGEAAAAMSALCIGGGGDADDLPPRLPLSERFPVIIGSEVMYELAHAELVAAVVKHRLAPGGCAVLHCAVRELKVFEHFARECRRRGLRYRRRHVTPAAAFSFEGILGRADEYEGGFLLMALDHVDSPCQEWYRDDWEETL
ncbi:hypothetical protein GPECTOR_7g1066 [Gonium pectorale]|uniref:Methyltransferase small domain-containing protein n=1 Tax=Gonium pectorale TaxID=33097 RepID=A0A150GTR5_GONPE|nr:hypothetical protein GPECTOR_7g1066 [Gonium pectorale]|eukprot:KXZ53174.1 hypothetical protein GPECTOR_7g1066 [Gonium pectorale]